MLTMIIEQPERNPKTAMAMAMAMATAKQQSNTVFGVLAVEHGPEISTIMAMTRGNK